MTLASDLAKCRGCRVPMFTSWVRWNDAGRPEGTIYSGAFGLCGQCYASARYHGTLPNPAPRTEQCGRRSKYGGHPCRRLVTPGSTCSDHRMDRIPQPPRRRHVRRGAPSLTTTQQGYGFAHQQERDRWRPIIAAGRGECTEPICLLPTRQIAPGSHWDLAHNRQTGGYRGPAHRKCNRAEGARHKEALRQQATRPRATTDQRDWHSRPWPG